MKTGVIGLGAMGAPMARNLHRAGYLEAIWNRTLSTAEQLGAELGVAVATDPAALAERCELLVLSVSADRDVLDVVQSLLPGLHAGSMVLDTSTVSRDTAREAAALLKTVGADFLDAPVSGGIEGARQGTLAMMIGGDAAVIERISPALDAIAARPHAIDLGAQIAHGPLRAYVMGERAFEEDYSNDDTAGHLERLASVHPRLAHYTLRDACGLEASPKK